MLNLIMLLRRVCEFWLLYTMETKQFYYVHIFQKNQQVVILYWAQPRDILLDLPIYVIHNILNHSFMSKLTVVNFFFSQFNLLMRIIFLFSILIMVWNDFSAQTYATIKFLDHNIDFWEFEIVLVHNLNSWGGSGMPSRDDRKEGVAEVGIVHAFWNKNVYMYTCSARCEKILVITVIDVMTSDILLTHN